MPNYDRDIEWAIKRICQWGEDINMVSTCAACQKTYLIRYAGCPHCSKWENVFWT